MSPDAWRFTVAFALTIAGLLGVVGSGFARRRGLHYALVVATLAALAVAIVFAGRMGRGLVFDGVAGVVRRVHMGFVALTFANLAAMVATGVGLARARVERAARVRRAHRVAAFTFLALVLVTTGLGLAMTLLARPA